MKDTFWYFYGLAFLIWGVFWLGYDVASKHWQIAALQGAFIIFFVGVLTVNHWALKHTNTIVKNITKVNVDLDAVAEALNKIVTRKRG